MKVKVSLCLLVFVFAGVFGCFAAEEERETVFIVDFIEKPLKMIFHPIEDEGLIDLILQPAEIVLSPLTVLKDVVVTPGRTREYVYNINKNVSVIDEGDIKETNSSSVQEILNQSSPGVVVNGFLNNPKDNGVDIRGFGEASPMNYLVLVDGRRTNQVDISGADLSQIDIRSIEKIEVLRGANSVLYGDNATGGVINIITRKGREDFRIDYVQDVGSYRYHKEYVSASGGQEFMDYFFSYSYQDSDGYRLNNSYEADDVLGNMTIKPSDFMDIAISSSYHRDWYGQPGALFLPNMERDGREASRFPDSKAKTEDYYVSVTPRVYGTCGDNKYVFSFFTTYRSRRSNSLSVGTNEYESTYHITSMDLRPKLEINSNFMDGFIENRLVLGADYLLSNNQVLSGDRRVVKSQIEILKETFGIYCIDNILLDKRYIFNAGVRGDWAEYIFDQCNPIAAYNTRSLREIAAEGGIGYKYNERSQVYANYARSYRYPATDEFFNSAYEYIDFFGNAQAVAASLNSELKHQIANNYEVGIKDNSFGGVRAKAAYYAIDTKKEIYFDPVAFRNTNYKNTFRHGLELEITAEIMGKAELFFSYTFQKAFFAGGTYAGKTIPLVPQNKISAGVTVNPVEYLECNLICNYVGSRYLPGDHSNLNPKLKEYFTVDLNAAVTIDKLRFFISIKNLFGERYFSSGNYNTWTGEAFYPAPERYFEGGVSLSF